MDEVDAVVDWEDDEEEEVEDDVGFNGLVEGYEQEDISQDNRLKPSHN